MGLQQGFRRKLGRFANDMALGIAEEANRVLEQFVKTLGLPSNMYASFQPFVCLICELVR